MYVDMRASFLIVVKLKGKNKAAIGAGCDMFRTDFTQDFCKTFAERKEIAQFSVFFGMDRYFISLCIRFRKFVASIISKRA